MSTTERGYWERAGRHWAVAAVWSSVGTAPGEVWVAADGCFDLILRVGNDGRASAFVSAPLAFARLVAIDKGDRHVGIRLRPGFGSALVDRPDLARAAGRFTWECADDLEALVASSVEAHTRPPNIVADFVAEANAAAGALRLTRALRVARERELQRACRRWLGLRPKAFLRITRAWAARDAIGTGRPLAQVAADLGYADQAHLTREARALLGVTPARLRAVGFLQDPAAPRR